MATITLDRVYEVFPAGTSVTPYRKQTLPKRLSGAPKNTTSGSAASVASDGSLTFTGLTPGEYTAYAQVSGADKYLHFTVKEHSTAVNVTTSSTSILSANPRRRWLELRNDSDTSINVELGTTATTSSAIELTAGDSFSRDDYKGPVSAIHAGSGNKSLQAAEG